MLMAPIPPLLLFIALLLSTTAATAFLTKPIPALILKACNHTGSNLHNLCILSLSAESPPPNADLRQLSIITARIAAENASQTAAYLSAQQTDVVVDPIIYQCVSDCTDLYIDVVDQLDTTTAAIDDEADKDAVSWLEAAIADVSSCENECGEAATAEIRRRNDGAKKLLNISLSFVKLLMTQKKL